MIKSLRLAVRLRMVRCREQLLRVKDVSNATEIPTADPHVVVGQKSGRGSLYEGPVGAICTSYG